MSDKNPNKDPLEELFQKKAEEFSIPYREADWKQLEKQLDIYDMRIIYRRRLIAITVAALLLIGFLGYFTYENHTRLNQLTDQVNIETAPEIESNESEIPALTEHDLQETNTFEPQNNLATPYSSEETEIPDTEFAVEQQASKEWLIRDVYTDNRNIKPIAIPGATFSDVSILTDDRSGTLITGQAIDEQEHHRRTEGSPGFLIADAKNIGIDDTQTRTSRILAGLSVSPDLSSVGRLSGFDDPGYKIGFAAEFALTKNLSVRAGIIVSQVRYTAGGSIYSPPNYQNSGFTPDETSAVCMLLDVPIGIKYNFVQFEKSRLFASVSLSSYFMINEDYRFRFQDYYNGNALEEQLSVRNGSRHFLNNAGFSVGYELDIHPNWSLRAEPFIQMPIREVGWGEVDLYSVGSYVSVFIQL